MAQKSIVKSAVRSVLSRVVVRGGLSALGRAAFPKPGALIFYGHRLGDDQLGFLTALRPDWFDEQIAYIARHYEVTPLSTLLQYFEEGRPIPENCAVLTFDDGFRDNLDVGLPILEKHGVPATFFVVSRSAETGELPWPQRLGYVYQHAPAERLGDALGGDDTLAARRAAFLKVRGEFYGLAQPDRDARIERVAEKLGVDPPRDQMLSWADLREAMAHGIEVGAHTYSHAWLSFLPHDEARHELLQCRDDLREHLGIEKAPFCFPAGSCNPGLVELVQEAGFRSAFLPNLPYRVNTLENATPFSLSRVGLPEAPVVELEAQTDGPFYPARQMLQALSKTEVEYSNDSRWRNEAAMR